MLDSVREKCDLHIRAAGIFIMQLELLEIQRLVTLSHNEGPIVAEEPGFATSQRDPTRGDRPPRLSPCEGERIEVRGSWPT